MRSDLGWSSLPPCVWFSPADFLAGKMVCKPLKPEHMFWSSGTMVDFWGIKGVNRMGDDRVPGSAGVRYPYAPKLSWHRDARALPPACAGRLRNCCCREASSRSAQKGIRRKKQKMVQLPTKGTGPHCHCERSRAECGNLRVQWRRLPRRAVTKKTPVTSR
jgi:hypothetical protein